MGSDFSYLLLESVFLGTVLALEWGFHQRLLWQRKQVLLKVMFTLYPYFVLIDFVAVRWGLWGFGADKVMPLLILGIPLEEYIFGILMSLAVSSATVIFSELEECGLRKREFPLYFFKLKRNFFRPEEA